ncbi:MAG: TIGR03087 family PEP-CTERM/XrtA system glycosyltransferase [Magnetospirillum sp.]|nr:TIGR03087 family PEP-CTERM/XrtA system glycosyltransferase [Magnetospirillum sp.]
MQDLLFLAHRLPYPPDKGDKLRAYHWLSYLGRRYRLHLGCFVDDPADWPHIGAMKAMAASICVRRLDRRIAALRSLRGLLTGVPLSLPFYADPGMARWVAGVRDEVRPAVTVVFSSQMAQYVVDDRSSPLVMDFCDVDSAKWRQYAERRRGLARWVYARESRRLLAFERRVAAVAAASLFVSAAERDLFRSLAPESEARLHVVENGIDAATISPDHPYPRPFSGDGPVAVFTGAMDYWPNVEAVTWFVATVLPLLPAFRLVVVGSNPSAAVLGLHAPPRVEVTGRVADVRPYLAHATVVVAPLLTARGVQNKVLEGMAMARPVVATPQAFEGIDAIPGRHLLVADGPEAFAAAVLQAAFTPASAAMAEAARRHIRARYAWESRFATLERLLEAVSA